MNSDNNLVWFEGSMGDNWSSGSVNDLLKPIRASWTIKYEWRVFSKYLAGLPLYPLSFVFSSLHKNKSIDEG